MSKILTGKQVKFCELVAEGKTQADAYRGAYDAENMTDKTIQEEASRLMSDPKISTRVETLRDMQTEEFVIRKEDLAKKLQASYEMCIQDKQGGASVSAIMGIAKMYGLIIDKQDHTSGGKPLENIGVNIVKAKK